MVRINKNNIEFTKGDTCTLRLELVNEKNEPVDLTGATGLLTVKEYLNDTTFAEKVSLPFFNHPEADPALGIVYFKFVPANTQNLKIKKYYYDIQINRGGDIYTVREGDIYLTKEVKFNV